MLSASSNFLKAYKQAVKVLLVISFVILFKQLLVNIKRLLLLAVCGILAGQQQIVILGKKPCAANKY
jgi:hypothetical protein